MIKSHSITNHKIGLLYLISSLYNSPIFILLILS